MKHKDKIKLARKHLNKGETKIFQSKWWMNRKLLNYKCELFKLK